MCIPEFARCKIALGRGVMKVHGLGWKLLPGDSRRKLPLDPRSVTVTDVREDASPKWWEADKNSAVSRPRVEKPTA